MSGCLLGAQLFSAVWQWLLVLGVAGFLAMGLDKAKAISGAWRISEKTLFILALVGGSFGVVLGSLAFHHKTSKMSFLVVLYAIVLVWLVALQRIGFLGCLSSGIIP